MVLEVKGVGCARARRVVNLATEHHEELAGEPRFMVCEPRRLKALFLFRLLSDLYPGKGVGVQVKFKQIV